MSSQKDWKAITIDWTALDDYDNESILGVCLTQRQVAVLKACLMPAYWSTRWENLTATADELDEFVAEIDSQLSSNDCGGLNMEFRDNPTDSCEVQYSNDGGVTWSTMFRKDNCSPGATPAEINQIYTDITNIANDYTTWNNDILNVAPDWEYVDANSPRALCWAIDFYVDMICDFAIQQIESHNDEVRSENDWVDDLGDIIGTGIVAGISAAAGAVTFPAIVIGAFVWASTEIVDAVWDYFVTVEADFFTDDDARQVVKCLMYEAQTGETPQFPAWRDSLQGWAQLGGNAGKIARSVHLWNQVERIYIEYMMLMEDINTIRATLPECPCPDRWTHEWNFVTHGMENWIIDSAYGEYQVGVGVVAEEELLTGDWKMNIIRYLALYEPIWNTDKWTFHTNVIRGTFDAIGPGYEMENPPDTPYSWNNGFVTTGTLSYTNTYPLRHLQYVRVAHALSDHTEGPITGTMIITGVTIEGVGEDPFYGRETS